MRPLVCIATALCIAGCTKPRVADTCPESTEVRCFTEVTCERDEQRQCMVCTCARPAGYEATPPPPGRLGRLEER